MENIYWSIYILIDLLNYYMQVKAVKKIYNACYNFFFMFMIFLIIKLLFLAMSVGKFYEWLKRNVLLRDFIK